MTEANIQRLVDFINKKRTYEEVEAAAFMIDDTWRSETWRRSLRRRSDIRAIGKDGGEPNGYNPVVGYEPVEVKPPIKNPESIQERLFKPSQLWG